MLPRRLWFFLLLGLAGAVEWTREPFHQAQIRSMKPQIALHYPPGADLPYREAKLFLDGQEVSDSCLKTRLFISYRPPRPLQRGSHSVRVALGTVEESWSFEVLGDPLIHGCVFEVPPKTRAFDPVKIEMKGETRGRAWAEIVGFAEQYPLKEKRGLYRGQFKVPAKLAGRQAQVEVFLEKSEQLDRQLCEGQLTIAALNLAVEWLSPLPLSTVEGRLLAQGRSLPQCQVEVRIQPFFRDGVEFGKLPPEQRLKLKTDDQGLFQVDCPIPPTQPRLALRLLAQARDAGDNLSPAVPLVLYLGRKVAVPFNLPISSPK